jgi:hypothetical protein
MTTNPFIPTTSGLGVNAGVVGTPGAITGTSSTSQTISTGTLSFQVPAQAAWAPGMFISAVSAASPSNFITGTVVSYSGTTLVINSTFTGGAGTYASWLINLSGAPSTAGSVGPSGPAGATGAAAGPLGAFAQGLKINNHSGTVSTKIDISALAATMVNSSGTSVLAKNVSVTIDLTTGTSTSAANGMDGEARGTSAWLYLYLINNGSTTAGLATLTSPLSGGPTLPSGYTSSLYVGAMRVDGSGNLLQTQQNGRRAHYVVTAATNTAALPTMGSGSAGSTSSPTWVAITLSSFVPATASSVQEVANSDVGGTATDVIAAPNNAYGTATSTNPPPLCAITGKQSGVATMPIESTSTYWASTGADGYLFCVGWDDYCVAA